MSHTSHTSLTLATRITEIKLEQEGPVRIVPIMTFDEAKFHPAMAKNVELCGYMVPTPIQKYCIPAIGSGHDVIGIAQTGEYFSSHLHDLARR